MWRFLFTSTCRTLCGFSQPLIYTIASFSHQSAPVPLTLHMVSRVCSGKRKKKCLVTVYSYIKFTTGPLFSTLVEAQTIECDIKGILILSPNTSYLTANHPTHSLKILFPWNVQHFPKHTHFNVALCLSHAKS